MGWSFNTTPKTKAQFVAGLVAKDTNSEGTTWTWLEHSLRGNHLWGILEVREADGTLLHRVIALELLQCMDGCWGHKSLSESMGPCEVDCPLGYLAKVEVAAGDYGAGWRDKVRAYHASRKAAKAAAKTIAPGQRYLLKNVALDDKTCTIIGPANKRGQWVIRAGNGSAYRVQTSRLGERIEDAAPAA